MLLLEETLPMIEIHLRTIAVLQRSLNTVYISLDVHVYRDKMVIFITLLCTDLIGPNPKQHHSKPSFSFLITGVLSKTVFEGTVGEC